MSRKKAICLFCGIFSTLPSHPTASEQPAPLFTSSEIPSWAWELVSQDRQAKTMSSGDASVASVASAAVGPGLGGKSTSAVWVQGESGRYLQVLMGSSCGVMVLMTFVLI